jgi:Leucine-rich repeat (LRR) protein
MADGKGFVAPTPGSIAEVKWVSFARVRAGRLNPSDLAHLAALPKLEEIVFGGNAASDAGVAEIVRAVPKLRRLWLFRSAITDVALIHVARLNELEALHLAGLRLSTLAMFQIARLKSLRTLDIDETDVGDAGLEAIKLMPALREVSFQGMRGVRRKGLTALASLRRLEILNLGFAEIDDAVGELGASRSLRELYLFRSTVTDAQAPALARIKTLRTLSLAYTTIGDGMMPALAGLPHLHALSLVGTRVSDAGLRVLARSKTLAELDLSGTEIGDKGIEALQDLRKLASLVLRESKITDAGIAVLARFPALKHVDFGDTAVTQAGARALAKALPAARVVGNER